MMPTVGSREIENPQVFTGDPFMKGKAKGPTNQSSSEACDNRALQEKVASLERQLKKEKLRADAYDTMIDIAEKKFSIPIRKKAGAKQ